MRDALGDLRKQSADNSGPLDASCEGRFLWCSAIALVHVEEVYALDNHLHQNFTRARMWLDDLDRRKDLKSPRFVHDDGAHRSMSFLRWNAYASGATLTRPRHR